MKRHGRWGVFLDRDGTLFRLVPYLKETRQAKLYEGVGEALKTLQAAGARLVVVTNQAGVARGLMTRADVDRLHAHLKRLLRAEDVRLDGIEVCFDHPDFTTSCNCRKPAPGMLLTAAERLGIELGESWIIGDSASDLEAGRAAGTRTALVLTGYGRKTRGTKTGKDADVVAGSLRSAVDLLLAERKATR